MHWTWGSLQLNEGETNDIYMIYLKNFGIYQKERQKIFFPCYTTKPRSDVAKNKMGFFKKPPIDLPSIWTIISYFFCFPPLYSSAVCTFNVQILIAVIGKQIISKRKDF